MITSTAPPAQIAVEMMQQLVESSGPAREPAADMADLAEVIRTLLAVEARRQPGGQ